MTKTFTALDLLADRCTLAGKAQRRHEDRATTRQERDAVCMKSYHNGEAVAYIDAAKIMEAELRRLCNRFQNGALSIDDFGINL